MCTGAYGAFIPDYRATALLTTLVGSTVIVFFGGGGISANTLVKFEAGVTFFLGRGYVQILLAIRRVNRK